MIKNFSIFKRPASDNDKLPTHSISAKVGEQYVDIGACWTKEGAKGKYLSCKMSDEYKDHTDQTKSRKGYHVAVDPQELTTGSTKPKIDSSEDLGPF